MARLHRRTTTLFLFTFLLTLSLLISPLAAIAAPAAARTSSQAALPSSTIAPPWCGTPPATPEWISTLPDGSGAKDPAGSFAHIPVYAFACTLADIQARSMGRMTTQVFAQSAGGRDMYLVTINALDTPQQRKDFQTWQNIRKIALTDPARAQAMVDRAGDKLKVPVFIQSAIHGTEAEGVDATFELIERVATTPYGQDAEVDAILDHVILLWNVDQNPDGRVLGQRGNANNFDMNRDYVTQSQPETQASVSVIQEWLPIDMVDQHGYVTPTLIEGTTKPHNPSVDYDLWLKWNPARGDANEAAMNAVGLAVTRPILDWCSDGNPPPAILDGKPNELGLCANHQPPGPSQAESWDDWAPFYGPMYSQVVGLIGSTVEMCNRTDGSCNFGGATSPTGRMASKVAQYTVAWSTLQFDLKYRQGMLRDQLERYRRGVINADRPPCCASPYLTDGLWMRPFPKAYVIPMGPGQRSDVEANRLVDWLLTNGVVVDEMKQDTTWNGVTFAKGSYVVWMTQAHRAVADTALNIGSNVSGLISVLYAAPAAWSHGYLWGADTTYVPREDKTFAPITNRVPKASHLLGGVEPGVANAYVLAVNSPAAVRTLNSLLAAGFPAELAMKSFTSPAGDTIPAGSAIFAADPATKVALASAGRTNDVWFSRAYKAGLPATEPIDRVPHIAVLASSATQEVWVMRQLGFVSDPISTTVTSPLNNPSGANPLDGYDVIFNTAAWPTSNKPAEIPVTSRARLQAFFAGGGGYIGALSNGAGFLTSAGVVSGLTAATGGNRGDGTSGIILWNNEGGVNSLVTGAFPAQDTATMDPPTWFTGVPSTMSVDGRLPAKDFFLAGMWNDYMKSTAPNAPVVIHGAGVNAYGNARLTVFAMNPLYKADPEREWAMLASAAYWADK